MKKLNCFPFNLERSTYDLKEKFNPSGSIIILYWKTSRKALVECYYIKEIL